MGLQWNRDQVDVYKLLQEGATYQDLKAKGYKKSFIDKVKAALSKGDVPLKATEKPEKESAPGEPLFSATLKVKKMSLNPMIAVRYDSVRHALGFDDGYTLEQFLDESTDLVNGLVGAVPPGFTKEGQSEEPVAAGSTAGGGQ